MENNFIFNNVSIDDSIDELLNVTPQQNDNTHDNTNDDLNDDSIDDTNNDSNNDTNNDSNNELIGDSSNNDVNNELIDSLNNDVNNELIDDCPNGDANNEQIDSPNNVSNDESLKYNYLIDVGEEHIEKILKSFKQQLFCINNTLKISINQRRKLYAMMTDLLNDIFLDDAKNFRSSFITKIRQIFSALYEIGAHIATINTLQILDKRQTKDKNNEYVFKHLFFGFTFVIKILAMYNDEDCVKLEEKISEHLTTNFLLTNICPHFSLFISSIYLHNKIEKYKLKMPENVGLIYHYTEPWTFYFLKEYHDVRDLSELLITFKKYSEKINKSSITNILFVVMFQIMYSLCVMTRDKIVHNDLRCSNIMLNGGYPININMYDKYTIKTNNENTDYYIPNYGFQVKIIDFGLSTSHAIPDLKKKDSDYLFSNSGIFGVYSDIYDIHTLINDILCRNIVNTIAPTFHDFLLKIVNIKYIGRHKSNSFINEYWRLAFPYEIKYFLQHIDTYKQYTGHKLNNTTIRHLKYDSKGNLIVSYGLKYQLLHFFMNICEESELDKSICHSISDPFDNNKNMILNSLEAIKLFDMFKTEKETSQINNTYIYEY